MILAIGCGKEKQPAESMPQRQEIPMTIQLTSPAFATDAPIPTKYTADGPDISPSLGWQNLPQGTKQVALIVDDPDAPRDQPWVHWVIYGIPGSVEGLPENLAKNREISQPVLALQGVNDFGKIGYGGPAPPKGHGIHHYHFKIYALEKTLDLEPGLTKQQLLDAIKGHVIAQGELIGTYER